MNPVLQALLWSYHTIGFEPMTESCALNNEPFFDGIFIIRQYAER